MAGAYAPAYAGETLKYVHYKKIIRKSRGSGMRMRITKLLDILEGKEATIVIRALKRSRIRRDVLIYLLGIYPEGSYLAEIAKKIDATPSNVIGAIRGTKGRYDKALSLFSLGLVDYNEVEGYNYYRLTDKGKEVARVLKNLEEF